VFELGGADRQLMGDQKLTRGAGDNAQFQEERKAPARTRRASITSADR